MHRRRPLAALLLVPASLAVLVVPAGAGTRTTWTHKTLHCAGRKSATVTYKWQGGAVVDSWADNRCGHQYVAMTWCQVGGDSPKCGQATVWPKTKAHVGGGNVENSAGLTIGPECDGPPPVEICEA